MHLSTRLQTALNQISSPLRELLADIVQSENFNASISQQQFADLLKNTQLNERELRLALLPFAASYAIVPISHFYVGAIVRGGSGTLYFGCNMEFAGVSLQHTLHAEQSAISHAWAKGEDHILDITINYTPCGHCRQFMNELDQVENMLIQLPEQNPYKLAHFLPDAFGPTDLNIQTRLLAKQQQHFKLQQTDPVIRVAVAAANLSYAPYSQHFSGVAVQTENGAIFQGRYAENAAFNPSLSPLHMALNLINLAQAELSITRVVLAEVASSPISHAEQTQSLLKHVAPHIELELISL